MFNVFLRLRGRREITHECLDGTEGRIWDRSLGEALNGVHPMRLEIIHPPNEDPELIPDLVLRVSVYAYLVFPGEIPHDPLRGGVAFVPEVDSLEARVDDLSLLTLIPSQDVGIYIDSLTVPQGVVPPGLEEHPALSGVTADVFDVLPEHSKITRASM